MESSALYSFVFKGLLAEQALVTALPRKAVSADNRTSEIATRLGLDLLDESYLASARNMSVVYTAIAAFENSVRELVSSKLLEVKGANWWQECVSEAVRKRAESRKAEEQKVLWHSARGAALISYTDFGNLMSIIGTNWVHFEDLLQSQDWVRYIFDTLERSRNVIMHSGVLSFEDIERIGIVIRDWVKQTGG